MSTWMIFVLFFVAIGWMGNRRDRWGSRHQVSSGDEETRRELARVREMVDDLSSRFHVLETERDFYRELLDAPGAPALGQPAVDAPDPEVKTDESGDIG